MKIYLCANSEQANPAEGGKSDVSQKRPARMFTDILLATLRLVKLKSRDPD
jgi:hypothetical protein